MITGASSGIGEAFAKQLAKAGFNLVLVARREENLKRLCEEISTSTGVRAEYFTFDFCRAYENASSLMWEVDRITKGNVAILVHMAGNSDLAQHFTDKPLDRNVEILRLQAEGTLVTVQRFTEMMCKQRPHQRSAIVTAGALTAYLPLAGFSTASANKAYIRFLTLAAAEEFKEKIDFTCAHPIMVESEILKGRNPLFVTSDAFVASTLAKLGYVTETNGSWLHDIIMSLFGMLPEPIRMIGGYKLVPLFSKFLQRPVDMRPLKDKFPV